ncbi:MAG: excalibur calcium-binding domain-containing protein [Thermomonas sp.]
MLSAIIWLGYSNHQANTNAIAAAKTAQKPVPFQPSITTEKRTPSRPTSTDQGDSQIEPADYSREPAQFEAFTASTNGFKCDGRTHCSHMRSCEEANFFIQHCPNTSMDGDNDGIPCERQWC